MRLIDADALKRAMEEMLMSGKDAVESAYINEVVQIVIDEAPTIEAKPIVHARIKETGFDECYCSWGECSICGADNMLSSNYCPNCGAKMEGGDPHD